MNRLMALLPVLLGALCACGLQSSADSTDCNSTSVTPDQRITACTQHLATAQLSSQDRANAFYRRGMAWGDKRDYSRAIADYDKALQVNPLFVMAYYYRLTAENARSGKTSDVKKGSQSDIAGAKVRSQDTPAIVSEPKDAKGYNKRGIAWSQKREFDRAIADYNEALRIDPKYQFAYYNRGIAWRNKGDYDRAITDYNEALRLNPKDSDAYNNRGQAWAYKRDYDRAIADYGEALRVNPKDAKAYYNRGVAWGNKRDYERAISDYNEALRINPRDAKAYHNRGYAWFTSKNDIERALADYGEALRLDPKDVIAYTNRGNAWRAKREFEHAVADYSEALRINPQFAFAFYNRGVTWGMQRDYMRALADYDAALRINPQYTAALNSAAWLLATAPVASARNGTRAVDLARKALELSESKDPDIVDTLAAAYAEAGNFAEAVQWQERAMAFPVFLKNQGDEARKRIALYRKGKPYHESIAP